MWLSLFQCLFCSAPSCPKCYSPFSWITFDTIRIYLFFSWLSHTESWVVMVLLLSFATHPFIFKNVCVFVSSWMGVWVSTCVCVCHCLHILVTFVQVLLLINDIVIKLKLIMDQTKQNEKRNKQKTGKIAFAKGISQFECVCICGCICDCVRECDLNTSPLVCWAHYAFWYVHNLISHRIVWAFPEE